MRPRRLVAWFACTLLLVSAIAAAQTQPRLEMHRSDVNALDATGWQFATSSRGGFSVRMPMAFNDFSVHATDPNIGETVTHTIGAKSSEGIKISATEMPITPRSKVPADIGTMPAGIGRSPGTKISDVRREKKGDVDSVSFLATGPATSAYMRGIKTSKAVYSLTIEFPNEHRDTAASVKDEFFDSFQLKD